MSGPSAYLPTWAPVPRGGRFRCLGGVAARSACAKRLGIECFAARRAGAGILQEIVEFSAATLTESLDAPFSFGHDGSSN